MHVPSHWSKFEWLTHAPLVFCLDIPGLQPGKEVVSAEAWLDFRWVPTFIERRFGLSPAQYGPPLGIISLITAASFVVKGAIVDWLYARGIKDAHLRFYSWIILATFPITAFTFYMPTPLLFMIVFGVGQVVTISYLIYVSATIQLVMPNELRGRTTAIFLTVSSLLGVGVGPAIVGAMNDFLFMDPQQIGASLTIMFCSCVPVAWILFCLALGSLRQVMGEE